MAAFISIKDYDEIKNGNSVEIVVEAVNRSPMSVCVCPVHHDDAPYDITVYIKEDKRR